MDLFPTAYFGSIYYFSEICHSKRPIIEAHEHFIKQTGRTRCSILSANGIHRLSIPVIRKDGSKTEMADVTISTTEKWQKDHWKSIESAYSAAPYFDAYDREVKELIYQPEVNLLKFNAQITKKIVSLLDLDYQFEQTTSFVHSTEDVDYRSTDFEAPVECNPYIQVFSEKSNFSTNLSILDLLFCEGPMARNWIL